MMLTIRAKQGFDLDFFSQRMVPYFHQMIKTTKKLNGVIVECGVGSGFSLFNLIASEVYISESVGKDCRAIWAYDSFEGFPELTVEDTSKANVKSGIRKGRRWLAGKSNFNKRMAEAKLPLDKMEINLIKGFFVDTFPVSRNLPDAISLLHLDVDLYNSYKICLEYLAPKVVTGGVIMLDEYLDQEAKFPGAVKAVNEYINGSTFDINQDKFSKKYFLIKR